MKHWKLITGLLILLVFITFGSVKVFGQLPLPQIATACETRQGNLISFDDGFSFLKKCEGKSRRVILIGERGPKGDQGLPGPQAPQRI